jgi:hypothetical protein
MRKNILLSTYFTCFLGDSELTQHKLRKAGALRSKNDDIEKKEVSQTTESCSAYVAISSLRR